VRGIKVLFAVYMLLFVSSGHEVEQGLRPNTGRVLAVLWNLVKGSGSTSFFNLLLAETRPAERQDFKSKVLLLPKFTKNFVYHLRIVRARIYINMSSPLLGGRERIVVRAE
jgi:hypothetical protein